MLGIETGTLRHIVVNCTNLLSHLLEKHINAKQKSTFRSNKVGGVINMNLFHPKKKKQVLERMLSEKVNCRIFFLKSTNVFETYKQGQKDSTTGRAFV